MPSFSSGGLTLMPGVFIVTMISDLLMCGLSSEVLAGERGASRRWARCFGDVSFEYIQVITRGWNVCGSWTVQVRYPREKNVILGLGLRLLGIWGCGAANASFAGEEGAGMTTTAAAGEVQTWGLGKARIRSALWYSVLDG